MAEKLTNKFKGFFKGDAKTYKVLEKPKRGDPVNKEELRLWYNASGFPNLNSRGQEAFFKFLRGDIYTEDSEIVDISISAEGMSGDARRYQFWLKCRNLNLDSLFQDYVMDDDTKLKDVEESYAEREIKKNTAQEVDAYINKLKDSMKPDLDEQFSKFKVYLAEKEATMES